MTTTTTRPQRFAGWRLGAVHAVRLRYDEPPAGWECWNCGAPCGEPTAEDWHPCARVALHSPHEPNTLHIVRPFCAACALAALVARYGNPAAIPATVARLAGLDS
jgi:hypothetical protein